MATNASFSWEHFHNAPIVGIIRGLPLTVVQPIAQAYQEAGLTTLEITMNTLDAPKTISALRERVS